MIDEKIKQYDEILEMIEQTRKKARFLMKKLNAGETVNDTEVKAVESEVQAFLDKIQLVF